MQAMETTDARPVALWNPVDLCYTAAVPVLRAVVAGKLKPGITEVEAGKPAIVNGTEVLLGLSFICTKDNLDGFDF
jgi:hypothetical protein